MTITQPGLRRVQEARYGYAGNVIKMWPDLLGAIVDPSGTSTYEVYRRGVFDNPGAIGNRIANGNLTENSTTRELSATLDVSNTSTFVLDYGYRFIGSFASGGVLYQREVTFDVVRTPLNNHCPLNINDLKNVHTSIDETFDQSGESTDAHQRYILPAWEVVLQHIESLGRRPALLIDPVQLYPMAKAKALEMMFEGLMRTPGDLMDTLSKRWFERYELARKNFQPTYAPGDAKEAIKERAFAQPRVHVGPDRSAWFTWWWGAL